MRDVLGRYFCSAGFTATLLFNLCQKRGALVLKLLLEGSGVLCVHESSLFS